MSILSISVDHDLESSEKALGRILDLLSDPPLQEAGKDILASMTRRIDSGKFQPIAPSTIAIRARKGVSSSKPLRESGSLRRSLTFVRSGKGTIAIGTTDKRAELLRFGGLSGGFLPGHRIPPREFLEITRPIVESVTRDLLERVKKV